MGVCNDIITGCAQEDVVGGIYRLWVIPFDDVDSFTSATGDHSYSAVTTVTTADVWFEIKPKTHSLSLANAAVDSFGKSVTEVTVEGFLPQINKDTAHALECFKECRVVVIAELYEKKSSGNFKALVLGYDEDLRDDAGLKMAVGELIEAATEGQNGYNVTLTGKMIELIREYTGTLESNAGQTIDFGD